MNKIIRAITIIDIIVLLLNMILFAARKIGELWFWAIIAVSFLYLSWIKWQKKRKI